MQNYHTFSINDALEYAKKYSNSDLIHAEEIGDGNLNLVFKVYDQLRSQIVIKQALPYVRCVGESWPLTLDRARLEAHTLIEHYQHCPEHTVKILDFNPELSVMVMEDLSDYQIWRTAMLQDKYYSHACRQLAEYLAKTLFYTSDFYLHPHVKKQKVAQFINVEMCEITEDLFFNDPYIVHERNNYLPELESLVKELRGDQVLKQKVAQLKHYFFTHAEALLHGDIHTGSIFVNDHNLKVIDAEFGFFGPIGFDVGTAIGNLLLNYCANQNSQRIADVQELWVTFFSCFKQLAQQHTQDIALAQNGYVDVFLQKVEQDALGYAGTEMIRRTIGLSHVADLEQAADKQESMQRALVQGKKLIMQDQILTVSDIT